MGACTTSSKNAHGNVPIPRTVYLHRSDKCLLWIEGDRLDKQKIDIDVDLPEDSAILCSRDLFFVAGGTDSLGNLSASFLSINAKEMVVTERPDMPMPAKKGVLLQSGNWIYHAGGVGMRDSVNSIMRYHTEGDYWEDLGILVSLINPGAYIFEDRIYLVGGKDFATRDYNKDVFSISTHNLELKRENNLILPLECENPSCVGGNKAALIVVKDSAFKVTPNHVKRMPKLPEPLNGNYPIELNENRAVAYSYPKAFVSLTGAKFWSVYDITRKKEYQTGTDKQFTINRHLEQDRRHENAPDSSSSSSSDDAPDIVVQERLQSDSDSASDNEIQYHEKQSSKRSSSKHSSSSSEKAASPQDSERQEIDLVSAPEESSSEEQDREVSYNKPIVRRMSSSSEEEVRRSRMEIDIQPASKQIHYGKGEKISSSSSSSGSEKNRFRPPSANFNIQRLTNPKQNISQKYSAQINVKAKRKKSSSSSEEAEKPKGRAKKEVLRLFE